MKLFSDVVVVVVCLEPAACRVLLLLCSVKAKPKTLKGVKLSEAGRRGHSHEVGGKKSISLEYDVRSNTPVGQIDCSASFCRK